MNLRSFMLSMAILAAILGGVLACFLVAAGR